MTSFAPSPAQLTVRLVMYFVVFFGILIVAVSTWPDMVQHMPVGGHHALESADLASESAGPLTSGSNDKGAAEMAASLPNPGENLVSTILFLSFHLSGTILLMIPISWTYMATRQDIGYQKNFARALVVLPICATTIVLLIQDSLALAFGLAALVAAVRFRVALREAIDGVFIFAAICVGLAAGIGYLGIAAVMTVFFCFSCLFLWHVGFGENPLDTAQHEKKRAKLESEGAGSVVQDRSIP
jgi:hypothetical protein